ncbi:alcohol dehydrogenase catalytic domain-containing protein [Ochrobactrum sp. BTU2]|uniref:alcohol dehydrogenase catalytic domain-containing protein n=1 Tax=Ochrobactrum sp. BTU2 TaxID=2856166 RepID=UPI002119F1C2|nr:alcohol dehydrogenase catalytic domain-containing protein [Ochrobactrum sp. BTU2]MCQ9146158.1 alcohol dehydrogenase catalytic domain-containing protein [Ochrobactrum sp. BTU2]
MLHMMKAARLHAVGTNFSIDTIDIPKPGPHDVLVKVKACGIIPNMKNVMAHYSEWFPYLPLPPLPAIYGLDASGDVVAVGEKVKSISKGQRVYVNPGTSCGSCHACRCGQPINCDAYTFLGYFGFGPRSEELFQDYPYAGFAEYMTAPASSLVNIPDSVSYEAAARTGYLGTAYSALRKAGARSGQTVIISGATGTLGLGAVLSALAMGVTRIFAVARNRELLERVRNLAPGRIEVLSAGTKPLGDWVRQHTDGLGADIFIDAVGPGAPHALSLEGIGALRRGGRMVDIGGMSEPLPLEMFRLMCFQISVIGSLWFDVSEGEDMMRMAQAGTLDLSVFEHRTFSLDQIGEALDAVDNRAGGFSNVVVMHAGA